MKKTLGLVLAFAMVFSIVGIVSADEDFAFIDTFATADGQAPISLVNDAPVLGQSFTATEAFNSLMLAAPTWNTTDSHYTFILRADGPNGAVILNQRVENANDNEQIFNFDTLAAGVYYAEMSDVAGQAGWWTVPGTRAGAQAYANGDAVDGFRRLEIRRSHDAAAPSSESAPAGDSAPAPANPQTSDAGMIAYVVLAMMAAAGLIVVRRTSFMHN